MKSELMMSLGVALGTLTENGMRYSALPRHGKEIANALNEDLSDQWRDRRGVEVYSFALASESAPTRMLNIWAVHWCCATRPAQEPMW